ncbi:glycerophosphodiesterase [Actinomyces sp. oral taxon 178 str. F0338]|nr:glycerophosphodiesterase [Actinomyces sp. oral taxon 178 str. F0338]
MATLVFPTESPLKSTCARWSKGSLFGHWRSGVAFVQVICRSTRRGGQGALSTIRCIETPWSRQ